MREIIISKPAAAIDITYKKGGFAYRQSSCHQGCTREDDITERVDPIVYGVYVVLVAYDPYGLVSCLIKIKVLIWPATGPLNTLQECRVYGKEMKEGLKGEPNGEK